jgi:hypothetical protein
VLRSSRIRALLLFVALGTCGCGSDPLQVTTIQLGKSLNPDKTVGTHTTRFKPADTVYASVLMSEPTQKVSYKGAAATEFHMQTSSGLPAGDYKVEILLDGQSIGTREFRVEK